MYLTYFNIDLEPRNQAKICAAPTQNSRILPLVMICVDLVSLFTKRTPANKHILIALTMIDPATDWFEIVKVTNKSATSIQDLFHNTCLAHYQRSQFIVFDN
jgi:hypothetical protein